MVQLVVVLLEIVHLETLLLKMVQLGIGVVRLDELVVCFLNIQAVGRGLLQVVFKHLDRCCVVGPLGLVQQHLLQ